MKVLATGFRHLSTIGGVTPGGSFYAQTHSRGIGAHGCITFLKHLVTCLSDRLLVIWDGTPSHRSHEIQSYLRANSQLRIQIEPLPAYAPELNPVEGVWQQLKHVELRNICCENYSDLRKLISSAVIRLRRKPQLIQSFFHQSGLRIDEPKT